MHQHSLSLSLSQIDASHGNVQRADYNMLLPSKSFFSVDDDDGCCG